METFVELLQMHSIELIVDVRRFPGSRRLPHFNRGKLEEELRVNGISYIHLEALGGRREAGASPSKTGWKNAAFHAYAEHMKTSEFAESLDILIEEAAKRTAAVMCAEGLWWKCHRRLIADVLTAKGVEALHILPDGKVEEHKLPDFAEVDQGVLFYET